MWRSRAHLLFCMGLQKGRELYKQAGNENAVVTYLFLLKFVLLNFSEMIYCYFHISGV